jgi:flavin-dependent dehydrogenase
MSGSQNQFDVVVVGGGTAGIVAAIAAANTGARTCLVESSGYLGGTTYALANVVSFHNNRMEPVVAGIPQRIVDAAAVNSGLAASLMTNGHLPNPGGMSGTVTLIDSARLNLASFAMLEEAGVELMLHSLATDVSLQGNRLQSVSIVNKGGTHQLSAKCFIDASGDADLAVKAGAPYEKDAIGKGLTATMVYRVGGVDHAALVADFRRHPSG